MKTQIHCLADQLLKRCPKSGRVVGVRRDTRLARVLFPLVGLLSIGWFLLRTLPEPRRANYPCQNVAAGIGAGFIAWLSVLLLTVTGLRFIRRRVGVVAAVTVGVAAVAFVHYSDSFAATDPSGPPDTKAFWALEGANQPMGAGRGLFPGRVVWVRDTASTSWDGKEKSWWDDLHTDQAVVSRMFSKMLTAYTGSADDKAAWEALIKYYNRTHGRGDVAYKSGEKIVIKINANHDKKSYEWDNEAHPSPAAVYALVAQLIDVVGVAGNDITIAEPSQLIGNPIYNKIRAHPGAEYQKVWFADRDGAKAPQRIYPEPGTNSAIYFTMLDQAKGTFTKQVKFNLPKCYADATYLINLSILRGHRVFGVTLSSKNHFGSIYNTELDLYKPGETGNSAQKRFPKNMGLHSFALWDYQINNKLGEPSFSPFILGHKDLGGKELLYLVDGIFTSKGNEGGMIKFGSLDNDWCSSLFISQDPVALQSVGADILCHEPNVITDNPSFVPGLDNFLRESALANNPPSGFKYDPEGDGISISESLGVHEHWNNATDRKYSRNLGTGKGIELIYLGKP